MHLIYPPLKVPHLQMTHIFFLTLYIHPPLYTMSHNLAPPKNNYKIDQKGRDESAKKYKKIRILRVHYDVITDHLHWSHTHTLIISCHLNISQSRDDTGLVDAVRLPLILKSIYLCGAHCSIGLLTVLTSNRNNIIIIFKTPPFHRKSKRERSF